MTVHPESEWVHVLWGGIWLTVAAMVCLTGAAIFAPAEVLAQVVSAILAVLGSAITGIGLALSRVRHGGNGPQDGRCRYPPVDKN